MVNKVLDAIFPILFGAGGGVAGVTLDPLKIINPIVAIPITPEQIMATVVSAVIFSVIGGVVGYYVHKLMKKIDK